MSEPTVITLDNKNSVQILTQYIELAQQKGAYKLNEAEILKRASDVVVNSSQDPEINEVAAKNLLIQGIIKGQAHGAYTLNDAALLSKVVQFVGNSIHQSSEQTISEDSNTEENAITQVEENVQEFDDLSDLAEPIPLKPKEV